MVDFNKLTLKNIVLAVLFSMSLLCDEINAKNISDKFTVEKSGSGKPVFILPGLSSSPDVFRHALPEGVNGTVYWVTLAGFGGSPPPADLGNFTQSVADDLAQYLEKENLHQVTLIGHSMGGLISLLVASRQVDRVDRILVVDSVPFLAGLMLRDADPVQIKQRQEVMRLQFEAMSDDQFMAAMRQGLPVQATTAKSQAIVLADIARSDRHVIATAAAEIFATDYREILPDIKAAVTVLVPHNQYSLETQYQLLNKYKGLYTGLDNVAFKIVNDSRHFIMLDQPEIFAREVDHFIKRGRHE